jgi:hypothetical protein
VVVAAAIAVVVLVLVMVAPARTVADIVFHIIMNANRYEPYEHHIGTKHKREEERKKEGEKPAAGTVHA